MAELQAEYTAQQRLYKQVKSSLTALERELRALESDVQSRQDVLQATVETQEEARKQQQETSEVYSSAAVTRKEPAKKGNFFGEERLLEIEMQHLEKST